MMMHGRQFEGAWRNAIMKIQARLAFVPTGGTKAFTGAPPL